MQIILLLDDFLTNKNRESLFTILICIVGNFPIWRFFWKKKTSWKFVYIKRTDANLPIIKRFFYKKNRVSLFTF